MIEQWDRHYPEPAARAINELIRRYRAVSGVMQYAVEAMEKSAFTRQDTAPNPSHGPVDKVDGVLAEGV